MFEAGSTFEVVGCMLLRVLFAAVVGQLSVVCGIVADNVEAAEVFFGAEELEVPGSRGLVASLRHSGLNFDQLVDH